MAIIVEDGTGVAGANSYVTVAEFTAYAASRGFVLSGVLTAEQLLLRAMDYIESLNYLGELVDCDQLLMWPRVGVIYNCCHVVPDNTIPELLKRAQMEIAISIDQGIDPLAPMGRLTSSETVGPISVTYEKGANSTTIIRRAEVLLRKLLVRQSASFQVMRG